MSLVSAAAPSARLCVVGGCVARLPDATAQQGGGPQLRRGTRGSKRAHRAVSSCGRRGGRDAGPLSILKSDGIAPHAPDPTRAHKYARVRRGPATCSLAAHCSVGSQRRRRPPPSPHRPAVVIPRAARDEVGRRRCCRVRRGHRRRVRRVPLHHGTLSPAGCFPVGPGGILPVAHIASYARRYSRGPRQRGRRTPPEGGGGAAPRRRRTRGSRRGSTGCASSRPSSRRTADGRARAPATAGAVICGPGRRPEHLVALACIQLTSPPLFTMCLLLVNKG